MNDPFPAADLAPNCATCLTRLDPEEAGWVCQSCGAAVELTPSDDDGAPAWTDQLAVVELPSSRKLP